MVTIRLARGGSKKRPFYHLTVTNSRNARDGRFVERIGPADKLRNALLDDADTMPVTLLYGMSGTGKSSLAAYVVRQLDDSVFPDGVLWGSLEGLYVGLASLGFSMLVQTVWLWLRSRSALEQIHEPASSLAGSARND